MANTLKFGNSEWYGKEDTILAYNDENNNFKPLPFAFSRASSATVVNKAGLIETVGSGEPRIDYYDNTDGAMLLEPSRTNIHINSENFSDTLQGASATFGTITSPNGTLNASTIASTVDGNYKGFFETYSLTDQTYTFSAFVKYNNHQWISIYRIGQNISRFDVQNGVFGNNPSNLKAEDYGNGWYRLIFTFDASVGTNYFYIYTSEPNAENSQTGDSFYLYGVQQEIGSYPTSYIPTSGSTVTRVAETCNDAGTASTFNASEGTFFIKVNYINTTESFRISISDNTSNNKIIIATLNNKYYYEVRAVDTSVSASILSTIPQTTNEVLLAGTWKQNEFKFFINGTKIGEDTLGNSPNELNTVRFNNLATNQPFYGRARDLRVYNTVLTDAELTALTS